MLRVHGIPTMVDVLEIDPKGIFRARGILHFSCGSDCGYGVVCGVSVAGQVAYSNFRVFPASGRVHPFQLKTGGGR